MLKDKVSDQELGNVAGGRGQSGSYCCGVSPDNQTFESYFYGAGGECPNFVRKDPTSRTEHCSVCMHLRTI